MCGDILGERFAALFCSEFLVASVHLNQSYNVEGGSFVSLLVLGNMSLLPVITCVSIVIFSQLHFPLLNDSEIKCFFHTIRDIKTRNNYQLNVL